MSSEIVKKSPERRWREKPSVRIRMTTDEWRQRLLSNEDRITINGKFYDLQAEKIFDGVVEVFIEEFQGF